MNITANLSTWSDADFAAAFRLRTATNPDAFYDFTGCTLQMMVRKNPSDIEVFISLTSGPQPTPYNTNWSGIIFNEPELNGQTEVLNIVILRGDFINMQPGDYVQSLIMQRPDGVYEDIWHGTLTHQIGPTR